MTNYNAHPSSQSGLQPSEFYLPLPDRHNYLIVLQHYSHISHRQHSSTRSERPTCNSSVMDDLCVTKVHTSERYVTYISMILSFGRRWLKNLQSIFASLWRLCVTHLCTATRRSATSRVFVGAVHH